MANSQPENDPIFKQPGRTEDIRMSHPSLSNVPPGLENLATIDQLFVHQKVELMEALVGFETKNRYTVKNSLGQIMFYAFEESDCCARCCLGSSRPFGMKIMDNLQTEVIHLDRPLACNFPCCLQMIEISSPPGTVVGTIEQQLRFWKPEFHIKDAVGDVVYIIKAPCNRFSFCGNDVNFKIMSADGLTQVGKISKKWAGFLKEAFTDADCFGITFPMDLDVKMKAVMLGACFLVDYMFYENSN